MHFNYRKDIIEMTQKWKGERFPDGRPKVADKYLNALYNMTLEDLWKPIFLNGYENQFMAMKSLHPEFENDGTVNKLVGRAVTAVYAPTRPDYFEAAQKVAESAGFTGLPNQWVIDSVGERDVVVVDMFDKVFKGTFLGGNLTTALKKKTKNGGAVIWGGIRDVEQMKEIKDVQVYYRGIDPTPIRDFVMIGFNVPTRLGEGDHAAICMPGDVVYGCGGGVLFIPPHLVEQVIKSGAKTKVKDLFGFEMISQNRFTTAQIDRNIWTKEMLDMLVEFIKTDKKAKKYQDLDWTEEYKLADSGSSLTNESAL